MGEQYADVLDLADWSALLAAFEEQAGQTRQTLPPLPGGAVMPGTG